MYNITKKLLPLQAKKQSKAHLLETNNSKNNYMKPLNKQFAPKSVMPEKVIQFGEGNFLRAFVDWIIWNMDQKTDFNGSVVVVQHGMAYSRPCRDGHHLGVAVALLHKLLFRRLEDFRGRV